MAGRISHAEDSELLERIARGDARAFENFYERYWEFVFNAAFKRLNQIDPARDISQEVFSQLWSAWQSDGVPVIDNVKAYLYVAVRNHAFKWIEREQRFVPVADVLISLQSQSDCSDYRLLFEELLDAYHQVVNRLPDQQQLIFRLRYEEEMTSREIAEQLHLSEKTVRNQLGRALGKVKGRLIMWIIFLFSNGMG